MKKAIKIFAILGAVLMVLATVIGIGWSFGETIKILTHNVFGALVLSLTFWIRRAVHAIVFVVVCFILISRSKQSSGSVVPEILLTIYFGFVSTAVNMISTNIFRPDRYPFASNRGWSIYRYILTHIAGILNGGKSQNMLSALDIYEYYTKPHFQNVQFIYIWAVVCFVIAAVLSILDKKGKKANNRIFVIASIAFTVIGIVVGLIMTVPRIKFYSQFDGIAMSVAADAYLVRRLIHMIVCVVVGIFMLKRSRKTTGKIVPECVTIGYLGYLSVMIGGILNKYLFDERLLRLESKLSRIGFVKSWCLKYFPRRELYDSLSPIVELSNTVVKYKFAKIEFLFVMGLLCLIIATVISIYNNKFKDEEVLVEE